MQVAEMQDPNYLGQTRDIDVMGQLVDWNGKTVIDVGCGNGGLAGALAKRGAVVTGIEPDPIQAEANRKAEPRPNVTLMQAPAEAMPVPDNSADVVIFSKSLHHVPADHMDKALHEAARVLKKDSGILYVMEPDIRGDYSVLVKPFHDETMVRGQALAALDRTALTLFKSMDEYWYSTEMRFANFDAFVDRAAGQTYNGHDRAKVSAPPIRNAFEKSRRGEDYVFNDLMRVRLYRGVKS